jgi:prepilin-type N-terminal cleavage/methylation domain-containing protein
MSTNRPIKVKPPAGFSLLEMVIALTLFGMIVGTLFSLVQGSVKGAAQLEQLQRETDAVNRFIDLCRKTFSTLPSTASISLTLLDANVPGAVQQELTLSGAPSAFGLGRNAISYQDSLLGLRADPEGRVDENEAALHYLCISRADLIPQTDSSGLALRQETTGLAAPDEQGRYWLPLLPDVVAMQWRFYQQAEDAWLESWEESEWPRLIELQLTLRDRTTPVRMVFSLPQLVIREGNGAAAVSNAAVTDASGSDSTNGETNNPPQNKEGTPPREPPPGGPPPGGGGPPGR